jgi:uncharacterized protein YhbP (UPF0306 family)
MPVNDTPDMPEQIVEFLNVASVATVATSIDDHPYCAPIYYAYVPEAQLLAFKSDSDTKHIEDAIHNNLVAGSILPDKIESNKPKGIQFTGVFYKAEANEISEKAKSAYLKKFRAAGIFRGDVWLIELSKVKFTDNTLVFGKKLQWER